MKVIFGLTFVSKSNFIIRDLELRFMNWFNSNVIVCFLNAKLHFRFGDPYMKKELVPEAKSTLFIVLFLNVISPIYVKVNMAPYALNAIGPIVLFLKINEFKR
jgi:hypothetical protein